MNSRCFFRWAPVLWGLVAGPASGLEGEPTGWVEVRADDGRLTQESLGWRSGDAEARVWRHDDASGAAWLRWRGVQTGPLAARPAPEGERAWGPGTSLSAGHWGLDVDLDAVRAWGIQTPESFEAGGQAVWADGGWTLAAGADRRWSLAASTTGEAPWTDEGRVGLRWDDAGADAGVEAGVQTVSGGRRTWSGRGRFRVSGPVHLSAQASVEGPAGVLWKGRAAAGSRPWTLSWSGQGPGQGLGRYQLAWSVRPWTAWGAWEPGTVDAGLRTGFSVGNLDATAGVTTRWDDGCTVTTAWGLAGAAPGGRWSVDWTATSDRGAQTLEASWAADGFTATGRWKTEGTALGWLGPRSSLTLTLGWRF